MTQEIWRQKNSDEELGWIPKGIPLRIVKYHHSIDLETFQYYEAVMLANAENPKITFSIPKDYFEEHYEPTEA